MDQLSHCTPQAAVGGCSTGGKVWRVGFKPGAETSWLREPRWQRMGQTPEQEKRGCVHVLQDEPAVLKSAKQSWRSSRLLLAGCHCVGGRTMNDVRSLPLLSLPFPVFPQCSLKLLSPFFKCLAPPSGMDVRKMTMMVNNGHSCDGKHHIICIYTYGKYASV